MCNDIQEQNDSVVKVTLCYLGASVNLDTRQVAVKKRHKQKTQTKKKKEGTVSRELDLPPTGVVVQQQARGYTPVSVYRCQLRPGGKNLTILSHTCIYIAIV